MCTTERGGNTYVKRCTTARGSCRRLSQVDWPLRIGRMYLEGEETQEKEKKVYAEWGRGAEWRWGVWSGEEGKEGRKDDT